MTRRILAALTVAALAVVVTNAVGVWAIGGRER